MPLTPTRRLALLVALTAPAWLVPLGPGGVGAGIVATGLVLLAALVDAVLAVRKDGVTVERELPARVPLGEVAQGRYVVRSRTPRRLAVELFDSWPAALEPHDAAGQPLPPREARRAPAPRAVLDVPPGGSAELVIGVLPQERGVHRPGPVGLRIPGPLGLTARTLAVALDDELVVVPSLAGVRRYRLLALHHRMHELGIRNVRRRGEGTALAGLRDYVPGDDPRRIDWKATARRGHLTLREHELEQGQTVLIALDCGRRMTQTAGDRTRFEYALSAALVLADIASRSGDRVGLLAFDDAVRAWVAPLRGAAALERVRDAALPLQATMAEPDYATAFATLAARHRRRALVVLLTDVVEPRAAQALVAHLTRGATRHLPLVVALRDEALRAVAVGEARASAAAGVDRRTRQDAAAAVYERAAAEELLLVREEAMARMRQAGASVVDVAPHAMAGAVVNRYLELKRRGAV